MAFQYLPQALSLVGGIKSLLGEEDDPYADIREQVGSLMEEMRGRYPLARSGLRTQAGQTFGGLANRLTDQGAAAGLPENVVAQNVIKAGTGVNEGLMRALGQLNIQEDRSLMNIAQIIAGVPPKPSDTFGEDLLGTGLQFWMAQLLNGGGGGGGSRSAPLWGDMGKMVPLGR